MRASSDRAREVLEGVHEDALEVDGLADIDLLAAAEEPGNQTAQLGPGDVGPKAVVETSAAEREVAVRFAGDVEVPRVDEDCFVVVGGFVEHDNAAPPEQLFDCRFEQAG